MGLLDWLGRKHSAVLPEPDQIFLTSAARWAAFVRRVRERLDEGDSVLVVAYFPATLRSAEEKLTAAGIDPRTLDGALSPADVPEALPKPPASAPLLAPLPALIAGDDSIPVPSSDQQGRLTIIVPEVHPLRDAERRLLAFASAIPMRVRVEPLASLDEPLMALFSGPWVQELLRKMGMKEDEAIESPLVSRRIRAAQDRILKQVTSFEPAESAEEWMRRNVPNAD